MCNVAISVLPFNLSLPCLLCSAVHVQDGQMLLRMVMTRIPAGQVVGPPSQKETMDVDFQANVDTADKVAAKIAARLGLSADDLQACTAALRKWPVNKWFAKEQPNPVKQASFSRTAVSTDASAAAGVAAGLRNGCGLQLPTISEDDALVHVTVSLIKDQAKHSTGKHLTSGLSTGTAVAQPYSFETALSARDALSYDCQANDQNQTKLQHLCSHRSPVAPTLDAMATNEALYQTAALLGRMQTRDTCALTPPQSCSAPVLRAANLATAAAVTAHMAPHVPSMVSIKFEPCTPL